MIITEVFEILMGAAGFVTGKAPEAAVDRLALEARAAGLDLGNDGTTRELGTPSALVEAFDVVDDGVSAARAAVGELGLP